MIKTLDIKGIIKFITIIGTILPLFFMMPILIGVYYGEDISKFVIFDIIFFLINAITLFRLRNHKITLQIKGSIIAVNIIWIMLGIAGAIPYMLYTPIDFSSAFFESVSGFTTTGATVFSEIEALPKMVLFLRSLTHWLGGMGIIVLGIGLLSIVNPTGSLSMFKAESTGISVDKIAPKIRDTALMLWVIYSVLTLADMLLLKYFGMGWFDAINHAFSTISTGGFSTKNSSLGYFNSSSAIVWTTTTGATVFSEIEALPKMVLFLRSLTHWLGGMGIIVLGIGLLSIVNPTGSLSMFKAESTGISVDKIAPKIRDTALMLWVIYSILTLADMFLLKYFGMGWFDAINHAFSTISTGGFSTKNSSLGYFNSSSAIVWTTTIFMIISGINFLAHLKFLNRDYSGYKSEEIRYYLYIFLVLSILLTVVHLISNNVGLFDALKDSFFTIASIMTTTGFATLNYEDWGHTAVMIIFIAMLIGGTTGSTAGGIKVIRYIIIFKNMFIEIKRVLHPNAILSIFIDGKKLKSSLLTSIFGFFTLYVLTAIVVMLYLYARGLDEMTSISTALATVGNIGPGFSLVGPVDNYGFFSWYDKLILSIAMIIGRLECYTVYLMLSREFWKKF